MIHYCAVRSFSGGRWQKGAQASPRRGACRSCSSGRRWIWDIRSKQASKQPPTYHSIFMCVCVCMCVFVNRFCKDLSTSKIYNFGLTVFFDLVSLGSTSRKKMIKDSNSLQMVAIHRRRHRRRNTTASSGSKNSLISKFLEIKTACTWEFQLWRPTRVLPTEHYIHKTAAAEAAAAFVTSARKSWRRRWPQVVSWIFFLLSLCNSCKCRQDDQITRPSLSKNSLCFIVYFV